jgi:predicted transcriptional regulator
MSLTQPLREHSIDTKSNAERESSSGELLALLDDEHVRTILEAVRTETKPARALADECGVSRPTVYRRLNDLEDAGLVESRLALDADGHHRTVFRATLQRVSVDLTGDGLSITVTRDETGTPPERHGNHTVTPRSQQQ